MAKLYQTNTMIDSIDEKIRGVKSDFNQELLKVERSFTTIFTEHRSKIDDRCKMYEQKFEEYSKGIHSKIEGYVRLLKLFATFVAITILLLVISLGILFSKCSASTENSSIESDDFILGSIEPSEISEPVVEINLTDITAPSNLTVDQLNEIISERLSDIGRTSTAMSNIGEYLVKMETDHKVNALFCLAVATLESGHGTSYAARNKNNLFGIMYKGSTRRFSSLEEGILCWGKLIREKYIDTGRTTISSIANKYCANPTHWTNSVSSFMNTYASYVKN